MATYRMLMSFEIHDMHGYFRVQKSVGCCEKKVELLKPVQHAIVGGNECFQIKNFLER